MTDQHSDDNKLVAERRAKLDAIRAQCKSNGFPKRVMNIDRAKSEIHYLPKTSINDGLKLTWDWFLENNKEYLKRQNYFK